MGATGCARKALLQSDDHWKCLRWGSRWSETAQFVRHDFNIKRSYGGFHKWGYPQWMVYKGKLWNTLLKWMITRGTPVSGNHHMGVSENSEHLCTLPRWLFKKGYFGTMTIISGIRGTLFSDILIVRRLIRMDTGYGSKLLSERKTGYAVNHKH